MSSAFSILAGTADADSHSGATTAFFGSGFSDLSALDQCATVRPSFVIVISTGVLGASAK